MSWRERIAQWLSEDYTISKRTLGIALLLGGIAATAGILAIDLLDVGREGGIGPAQAAALGASILVTIIGATLIPLGDKPA